MNSSRPDLLLDWCSRDAALYAARTWHYSKTLSAAKNVYVGVWEEGRFIGAIVFGIGAGSVTNGKRYGLKPQGEMAELTRVALAPDHRSPVSRIVAIAMRMIKRQSPGLRMVISFADPARGHHGGIYQAGNWIYAGTTKPDIQYRVKGVWVHHRTATSRGSAAGLPSRKLPPKHRYLMPLDDEIRARVRGLSSTYPKRAKQAMDGDQPSQRRGSTDRHAPGAH